MKFSELKNGDHYSFTCESMGWSEEPRWVEKNNEYVGTIRLFNGNEDVDLELWGKNLHEWRTQNWQEGHWFEIENARMEINEEWGDKLKWCTGKVHHWSYLCKKAECEGTKINLHGKTSWKSHLLQKPADKSEYLSHAKKLPKPDYKYYRKYLTDNGIESIEKEYQKVRKETVKKLTELIELLKEGKKNSYDKIQDKEAEIKKIESKGLGINMKEIEFYKKTNINAKTLKIFGENIEKYQEVKELMKDAKKNYLEYKPKFDSKLFLEEKTSEILTTDKIELDGRIKAVTEGVPLSDINNKSLENIKNKLQILKRKKTQERNKDKRNDYKF